MTPEEYYGRVQATAWQAADYVPSERLGNVQRLIEHGEPADGMRALAWVIVRERILVPQALVDTIREYAAELIDDEDMPTDLDAYVRHGEASEKRPPKPVKGGTST